MVSVSQMDSAPCSGLGQGMLSRMRVATADTFWMSVLVTAHSFASHAPNLVCATP